MFLRKMIVGVGFQAAGESKLSNLNDKVNKFSRDVQNLNRNLDRVGKTMMLKVTAPLVALGTGFVWAASNAEEMQSKFDVVFRGMEDSVRSWADEHADLWNRSRLDLQSYLGDTQNMLVGMGMARDAGAAFSKEIVQMGVDLASFNNLAESDAISSLHSSLIGNHMAARSLGAVLNENTLSLAMQQMGLKGTFQQLDENRKMQVRFRAIVMQSEDAIGDAVRTSDSFANQMRGLKGNVKDLSAEFGKLMIPTVSEYVGKLTNAVKWVGELDESQKGLIIRAGLLAAALGPAIWFISKLVTVGKGFGAAWMYISTTILTPALALLGGWAVKSKLAAVGFGLLKGSAMAVAGKLLLAFLIVQDLFYAVTGLGDSFFDNTGTTREFFLTMWGGLTDCWDLGKKFFKWLWEWPDHLNRAVDWFDDFTSNLVGSAKDGFDDLVEGFGNLPDRAIEAMKGFGGKLKGFFSRALQQARDLLPFSPVKDLSSPFADLEKAGRNIIGNIQKGMHDAAGDFPGAFTPTAAPAPAMVSGGGAFAPNIQLTVHVPPGKGAREAAVAVKKEMEKVLPGLLDEYYRMMAKKRPQTVES